MEPLPGAEDALLTVRELRIDRPDGQPLLEDVDLQAAEAVRLRNFACLTIETTTGTCLIA